MIPAALALSYIQGPGALFDHELAVSLAWYRQEQSAANGSGEVGGEAGSGGNSPERQRWLHLDGSSLQVKPDATAAALEETLRALAGLTRSGCLDIRSREVVKFW